MADTTIKAPDQTTYPEQMFDIASLILKHRPEIDRILVLNPDEQKTEIMKYGLSPQALEVHYKPLEERSITLQQRDMVAAKQTSVLAGIMALATLIVTFVKRKSISDNKLIQGTAVALGTTGAGIAGGMIGTQFFSRGIEKESKQLAKEARTVFEQELAIAIENTERTQIAQSMNTGLQPSPAEQQLPVQTPPSAAGLAMDSVKITPRETSYVAQAQQEKSAEAATGQLR